MLLWPQETETLQLQPTELCFLLDDLVRKLEHSLLATAGKRRCFLKVSLGSRLHSLLCLCSWWDAIYVKYNRTWGRPLGQPRATWMKTIQQDLKSNNLSLNETIDVAQNRPLWRLMSCVWCYAMWNWAVISSQLEFRTEMTVSIDKY